MSLNRIALIGNLGADPEIKPLDSGVSKTTFSLATSETYKAKDGQPVTITQWHNILLWRGLAETSGKYLKKGNQVYIEGKLTYRSYIDKEAIKRYRTEIVAEKLVFLNNERKKEIPVAVGDLLVK